MVQEETALNFARQLKEHRQATGISHSEAARRADMSRARWQQLETGYTKGSSGAYPSVPYAHNIGKIARAVNWDRDEALAAAGYNPADHPAESEVEERVEVPQMIHDAWPRLSKQQRVLVTQLVVELSRTKPRQDGRTFPNPQQSEEEPQVPAWEPTFSHATD